MRGEHWAELALADKLRLVADGLAGAWLRRLLNYVADGVEPITARSP